MKQLMLFIGKRTKCTLFGHRMNSERIYYAPAKDILPGYRCERCGKTQLMLWRWQSVEDGSHE